MCFVQMSSAKCHLDFLDNNARSAERLCKSELCCLGHRTRVSAMCLLCKIYHRVDHPMNEYQNYFVAPCSTRTSVVLEE